MKRHQTIIHIAAFALALAAGSAHGQELQLKEADIRKLIPLLQAQVASLGAAQAYFERQEAAQTSFSGDPLEFFSRRAELDLPQGVKYMAACSCAASVRGPVAIFTFGRSIDCYDRAWRDVWRGVKRGPDEKLPSEPSISAACRAEHDQTIKFLSNHQAVLEKRGYQFVSTGPGGFPIYLNSPGQVFRMDLERHNIYDRADPPDVHPLHLLIEDEQAREAALAACSNMPSGPIMVVHTGDRFFEKEPLDALEVALRKASLSEKQFEALKMSLFMARMDSQPEWFQGAAAAAGSDPDQLRALAIRQANATLYLKLAAELDPLLDALFPKQ